jgi:hypothetical protein
MANFFRPLSVSIMIACICFPKTGSAAAKAVDPCALLTQAEIQEVLGTPAQAGKLKANPNQAAEADCSYTIGDYGTFNLLLKPISASETPDRIYAEFKKRKIAGAELPGVGDRSFYINPGYGMTQLFTFKGERYILITMLVPGSTEPTQQAAAAKLMRKLLPRL